ncbi:MAG: PFL family protein, partial [Ruminococcus sp.]|nr:PFL family protein [Ruminococcus sp.]
MYNTNNILETISMLSNEHLDIRTITLGISLLDCISGSAEKSCAKIYDKICKKAEKLSHTAENLEKELGIPIVNKRISVTPISIISASSGDPIRYAKVLQRCADTLGVDFIGGYSALVHKGHSKSDIEFIRSVPEALSITQNICSSLNVGSTKSGINMEVVALVGEMIKVLAEKTANQNCIGPAKFVVFCNAVDDNPFMAGAFHGIGEPDCVLNVGVSGPGTVKAAISKNPDASLDELAEIIKKTAFKITRIGQLVAKKAAERMDIPFGIVDLSLAPTPVVGDSVADVLTEMGIEFAGAHGTTALLALLNDAVKKGGVMASSRVGGLSGAFIPVSEDSGMIAAAQVGAL